MMRACESWLQKLNFDLQNPDLAKDCGYSKKTIQYLEWTGFILSFILFAFRCKLGISFIGTGLTTFFFGTATIFCYNLIIFTIAVSNEDRINNLTTMAIIQQIFIVASTIIIFTYEILFNVVLIIIPAFFLLLFLVLVHMF